jgi:hypothetical protein
MADRTANVGIISCPGRTTWHIANQPADECITVHAVGQHDPICAIG